MTFPPRFHMGMTRQFDIDTYTHYRNKFRDNPADFTRLHDSDFRWLMGYRVPSWQRELGAWSRDQQISFIESCVLGLPLGHILVNNVSETVERDGERAFHHLDRILLDGQHRLHTLDQFLDNEFPVFGYHWQDFPHQESIRFLRMQMPAHETEITDEAALKDIYDRMAFGGTPHTEDQRASRDEDYAPGRLRP